MTQMSQSFSLAGKVALVTGSTTGIGRAIATAYADAGCRVYVHGLEHEEGEALAQQIGGAYLPGDLAVPDEVQQLAARIADAEERLDILVNNAGMEIGATVEHLEPAVLERTLAVNFVAPVRLTQLLLPLLRRSASASVINVTSIHDDVPAYGNTAYSCAKAALSMFSKTAAVELGPDGIRVNSLAPGAVETNLNRELLDEIGRDKFARWIPLGRVAQTDDIAGAAVFLGSDAASYVSGATLVVDGAYTRHLVRYRASSHT